MADENLSELAGFRRALRDLGDGTFAEVMVTRGESSTSVGDPTDPPWNGTDPSASLIAIMKAVHAQLVIIAGNTQ